MSSSLSQSKKEKKIPVDKDSGSEKLIGNIQPGASFAIYDQVYDDQLVAEKIQREQYARFFGDYDQSAEILHELQPGLGEEEPDIGALYQLGISNSSSSSSSSSSCGISRASSIRGKSTKSSSSKSRFSFKGEKDNKNQGEKEEEEEEEDQKNRYRSSWNYDDDENQEEEEEEEEEGRNDDTIEGWGCPESLKNVSLKEERVGLDMFFSSHENISKNRQPFPKKEDTELKLNDGLKPRPRDDLNSWTRLQRRQAPSSDSSDGKKSLSKSTKPSLQIFKCLKPLLNNTNETIGSIAFHPGDSSILAILRKNSILYAVEGLEEIHNVRKNSGSKLLYAAKKKNSVDEKLSYDLLYLDTASNQIIAIHENGKSEVFADTANFAFNDWMIQPNGEHLLLLSPNIPKQWLVLKREEKSGKYTPSNQVEFTTFAVHAASQVLLYISQEDSKLKYVIYKNYDTAKAMKGMKATEVSSKMMLDHLDPSGFTQIRTLIINALKFEHIAFYSPINKRLTITGTRDTKAIHTVDLCPSLDRSKIPYNDTSLLNRLASESEQVFFNFISSDTKSASYSLHLVTKSGEYVRILNRDVDGNGESSIVKLNSTILTASVDAKGETLCVVFEKDPRQVYRCSIEDLINEAKQLSPDKS